MRKNISGCFVGLLWVCFFVFLGQPEARGVTWGTTQHVWNTGGGYYYTPALGADGTIYAGANDMVFYAFNPNGTTQRMWSLDATIEDSPSVHSNGNVYVGTEDGYLYALLPDGSTNLIWESPMGSNIRGISIGPDGTLYMAPDGQDVYALSPDASVTQAVWHTAGWLTGSPAVAGDGSVYCVDGNDLLYQFLPDGTTGFTWSVDCLNAKPVLGWNGSVFLGSADTNLYEFKPDGTTGKMWTASGRITTEPVLDKYGNIYVADFNQRVYAFNYDGSTQNVWHLNGYPSRSPLLADDGTLYVASSAGILYGFQSDGTTGFAWHTSSGISAASPNMDTNGILYLGSTDGNLFAFDSVGKQVQQQSPWPAFRRTMQNTYAQPITHFVSTNGTAATPYLDWATAANNIQDAISISQPGELVLVGNGVYVDGGIIGPGMMHTNTISITNGIVVSSQNGPEHTYISGKKHSGTVGASAQRCAYVGSNAVLWGFSLTNGYSSDSGDVVLDQSGAGVLCSTNKSLVIDCTIANSYALHYGGGIYNGEAHHCRFFGNFANYGGAASYAHVVHSIINSNISYQGGGLRYCTASHCEIAYNNGGTYGGGIYRCDADNSQIHDNWVWSDVAQGGGSYEGELILCDVYNNRAQEGGGCYQSKLDLCAVMNNSAQSVGGGCVGGTITNTSITGNNAVYYGGGALNIRASDCYIGNNIVSNGNGGGVYGTLTSATLSNCIVAYNSVSDDGGGASGYTLYNCTVTENFATNNSASSGGGVYSCDVYDSTIQSNRAHNGGGAANSVLVNTLLYENDANAIYTNGPYGAGGGAYDCILTNCRVEWNNAINNGAGGGICRGRAYRCEMIGNYAEGQTSGTGGAGAWQAYLENCIVREGFAGSMGGGLMSSTAKHCTVYNNYAHLIGGGGLYECEVDNCIVYSNTVRATGASGPNHLDSTLRYSCSTFTNAVVNGNITNNPGFVDEMSDNFHITSNSPCVDAGTAVGVGNDIDGLPRPLDGNNDGTALPDMGAYEVLDALADSDHDTMPDGWELGYGLSPTNPADAGWDNDGDGPFNGQEYIADTDPIDSNSFFSVTRQSGTSEQTVFFMSSSNRTYTLEYALALEDNSWTNLPGQSNIQGSGVEDSLTDTNDAAAVQAYRVSVNLP